MVRDSARRKEKFEAKVDGAIQKAQIDKLKSSMVKAQEKYFGEMASLEAKVKALVEAQGVTSLEVRDYLNFGREIYEVTKKFSLRTMNVEAQIRVNKWVSRGLNSTLLCKIANLLGADPSPTPTPTQEVDVTDRPDRQLGEINNFPSEYPLPSSQITSLKPREDLTTYGSIASPNNAGVLIVSGDVGKKVKVFDASYEGAVDGLHYFYFGTSTTPTSKRFMVKNTKGVLIQTFTNPHVSDSGDNLYLFSSVSETNMPYSIHVIVE